MKSSIITIFLIALTVCFSLSAQAAPPVISVDGTNLAYVENAPPVQVDSAATLTDVEGNWDTGTLVVQITANSETADELSIPDNIVGSIVTTGTTLFNGLVAIGTLSDADGTVTNGSPLTITFNASATNALVQQVLQAISYRNTSDAPGTLDRIVTFIATDAAAENASGTRTIVVTASNDDPGIVGTLPTDIVVSEDLAGDFDLTVITFVDPDAATNDVVVTLTASAGTLSGLTGGGVITGGAGTGILTLSGTVTNLNAYLSTASNITYTGASDVNGNDASTVAIKINDGGNAGSGGGTDVALGTVNMDITAVNDAPTAIALSVNTIVQGSTGVAVDIGNLSSTDIDSGAFTYSLVADSTSDSGSCGAGNDVNNANFQTSATSLQTASVLAVNSYKVCVQTSDGDATFQQTFTITVTTNPPDLDGSLIAAATVTEPVALPWSADTTGEAVDLFDFALTDGGTFDGFPMTVSQVVIQVAGSSSDAERNKVTWRLNGNDANNVIGVYNAGTITFSGLSISIADGTSEVYTVNGFYTDNTGLIDGNTIILSVDGDTDLTVGASGTLMGATTAVNNGTGTVISDIAPVVISVNKPVDNTYGPGDNLDFTVNFDEIITVSGTPRLTLTIGSTTRFADYVSGSGSSALVFRYTVLVGDQDSNGIALAATIDLNSGTLQDGAGNNVKTTLNGVDSLAAVLVEAAAPVFQNATPSVSATTLTQTTLTVRLDEIGTAYYVLLPNGAGVPSAAQVKAGNDSSNTAAFKSGVINIATASTNFTANITGLTNNTAYALYVVAEDQSANLQATASEVLFTTDSINSDGNLTSAAVVTEPAVFSWSVDTVGEAIDLFDFTLSDGGTSDGLPMTVSQIIIRVTGSSFDTERNKVEWRLNGSDVNNQIGIYDNDEDTITFSGLTISIADGSSEIYTINGYYKNNVGLVNGHTIRLKVDGDNDLTVGASGTLMGITMPISNGAGMVISDDIAPTVISVSVPANNTYTTGDDLNFTVNFDEDITVSGIPRLALTIGATARSANYVSGSGSSVLLFRYTVLAGEQDSNGITLGGAIDLNSATLRDSANNNIITTLNSIGSLTSVLVEAAAPVFQNGTPSISATTLTQTTLTVRLDEIGTAYYVLLPNGAGMPSSTQVKAGNNSSNAAAFRSGNFNVASAGADASIDITGLTAGTTYNLYVVAEDALTNLQAVSSPVNFSTNPQNSDGNLTAAVAVTEPVALDWSVDTVGEAINLFDFTLKDGGASDGLAMTVSQIILRVTGSASNVDRAKVTWRLNGNDVNNAIGVYNAANTAITFSGLNISIADGDNERYTVNGYYNDNTGLTDGKTIILKVDGDTDLAIGASGTLMGSTTVVGNGLGTVIRDNIEPTVLSVSVPANSTYAPGNNLDFIVNFDENVTADTTGGVPSLTLTIGSATRSASFVPGSGSSALLFRYTVLAGDQDSDGISIGANVNLNGGTLQDSANNDANTSLNNVDSLASVLVDAVASSLAEVTPVVTPTNNQTPNVTFSSAEAGTFTVGGVCGSASGGSVTAGSTTIALTQTNNVTPLAAGTYSGCAITLTDGSGNVSNVTLSDFVIDLTNPTVTVNTGKSIGEGGMGAITVAKLNSTDNVSAAVNIIYTIIATPGNGVLLKNGGAIAVGDTFTQDDINNNLISYSNTNIGPTADAFIFTVMDQAGNIIAATNFNFVIGNDLDGDGIGDNTDTDDDGDGIPDDWEIANELDPRDASDATGDLDGDGKDNLSEFTEGTNPNLDDNPPVIIADDITLDATGLFTPVNVVVEGNVSASDFLDGSVTTTSNAPSLFSPGVTIVTWSAIDAAGNPATKEQKVNINPLVNFSVDQVVAENSMGSFRVILNGEAVSYPVNVPYAIVGGTADSNDHNLTNGTAIITSGNTETEVTFNVADAGAPITEDDENILLTLRALPSNVALGSKSSLEINITENNVAPISTLIATQAAFITQVVTVAGGDVSVTSNVTDPNTTDTHTYDWSASDNTLMDIDTDDSTFTFDPSSLAAATYTLRLTVSDDNSATGETALMLTVLDTAPILSATEDADGDFVNDQAEGFGDADVDGIPDYLDNIDAANVLPSVASSSSSMSFPLETEAGLKFGLGAIAVQVGKGQANIDMTDITNAGNSSDDAAYSYPAGLFDFEVTGIGIAGKSISMVLPQQQAIPANAIYRKILKANWQEFVIDANNALASAPGALGVCPPPGNVQYQTGLTQGHFCVQLTIQDGGANDSDGAINNRIADLGGVTRALIVPPAPVDPPVNSDDSNGIFGLGSLSAWWLSLFGLFGLRNYCIRTE